MEAARDVVQFANTLGGTLLYGVAEGHSPTSPWKVATGVPGVTEPDSFMEFLHQSVRPLVHPEGYNFTWRPLRCGEVTVVAVDAPPLATGIASVWNPKADGAAIEFFYRTDQGKRAMSPAAVEAHLLNTSRQTFLLVQQLLADLDAKALREHRAPDRSNNAVLASPVADLAVEQLEIRRGMLRPDRRSGALASWARQAATSGQEVITIETVTETELVILVRGRKTAVPLTRVSDIWLRSDNKIGLILEGTVVVPIQDRPPLYVYFEPS